MIDAILKRRSIRKYEDKEMLEEDIKEILEAAMYAPSAWGTRPWHFIVVKKSELKQKLSEATPYASHAAKAPVLIVLVADMNLAKKWVEDMSIAADHIMLQATDLGYGSCFIQIRGSNEKVQDAQEYIRELLKIPSDFNVECIVTLGKTAEEKDAHTRKEIDKMRIHLNGW
ncbi:NADH dehydrogenase [archaeon]|nr:NADH dehydrogenase [archaeon]